jgi:hypothetical protein
MTECNQSQFEFEAHFSRRVVAEFSGERLTTEGGACSQATARFLRVRQQMTIALEGGLS